MKSLIFVSKMLLLLSMCLGGTAAQAQSYKHPRVVELEKSLSQEALNLLKGRFPQHPFIVTVAIDPLLRDVQKKTSDKLPYYDLRDEEILDEWDDPNLSNAALLNRVKKTVVNVSVPNTLSEDEVGELKSALAKNLSLVEARDIVEIQKRQWSRLEDNQTLFNIWLPIGLVALLLIMAGIWAATWFGAKRLSGSLQEGFREAGKTAAASSGQNHPLPAMEAPERSNSTMPSGDLRFSDPIKNRETLRSGIQILNDNPAFPSLEDMMLLHTFAKDQPAAFGAFLVEFTLERRQQIFSLSFGDTWLYALSEPGEVDSSCIELLNKCLRHTRNELQKDWQHLLTLIWRLDNRRSEFFKGLPKAEAFPILASLPRSLSLHVAREVYPGAWGELLDPSLSLVPLKAERIQALCKQALTLSPLQNVQMLDRYKNQKDLLSYLKNVDPQIEKEIYQASGSLNLKELRPAFYPVFELSESQLDALVPRIKVEDWALAMFNVSRFERKKVESRFSDRQRMRYFELLKHFDSQMPTTLRIGEARERVAHSIRSLPAEAEPQDAGLQEKAA